MTNRFLTDSTLTDRAKNLFTGGEKFKNFIIETALESADVNASLKNWAAHYGIDLAPNQVEILEYIVSPRVSNLAIIAARQSGKTYSVGLGVIKLCLENPGYRVVIAAPKTDQATRVLKDCIVPLCKKNKSLYDEVDWDNGTTQRSMNFKNGSFIQCLSANDSTQQEGFSCFIAGTLVTMADGTKKPIEQIQEGDLVISINPETLEQTTKPIIAIASQEKEDIYEIEFDFAGQVKTFTCTGDHIIPTKRGLVMAKDLALSDEVIGYGV